MTERESVISTRLYADAQARKQKLEEIREEKK
jgi:hypothetical protein